MKIADKTRFDARLSKEKKEFFEYAASLGGYRSLTEFIIASVDDRAKKIVAEHNKFLASKRDQEIFFQALLEEPQPNEALQNAAAKYNQLLNSK